MLLNPLNEDHISNQSYHSPSAKQLLQSDLTAEYMTAQKDIVQTV